MSIKTISYSKQSKNSITNSRVGDPYWDQTELLLVGDGTNNQTNIVYTDSSSNNHTVNSVGGYVYQNRRGPISNMNSAYFKANGPYLQVTASTVFGFGSGDFTIEAWVFMETFTGSPKIMEICNNTGDSGGVTFGFNTSGQLVWKLANTTEIGVTTTAVSLGVWTHIAGVRSGTNWYCYINGTRESTASNGTASGTSQQLLIGRDINGAAVTFKGYMADYRIVKGTAVYTGSTYTVPSVPLTAITGTSILLQFNNIGINDRSARKNRVITISGAKNVTTLSKFGTGCIALNGTSDHVQVMSETGLTIGTSNFTIEMWIYPTSWSNTVTESNIIYTDALTNGILIGKSNNATGFVVKPYGGTNILSTTTLPTLNQWTHIAVCRHNNHTKLYYNGIYQAGGADSTDYQSNGSELLIGRSNVADTYFAGYIDDLRVTKGVARYGNFTTPVNQLPDYK